jgi:hypothetical protein
MLRNTFCALQVDAGRRLIWITPCKPKAQLGDMYSPPISELRSSSTRYGVARQSRDGARPVSTPSCAFGLHGVIHLGRLPASTCNAQIYILRNINE